ncbi:MAG: hypothetical protein ACYC77_00590 [Coriobacteriia bacterium]
MQTSRTIVDEAAGTCVCHIGDRIAAYEHLSHLLLGPASGALDAVQRLRSATVSCKRLEYLDEVRIVQAGVEAASVLAKPASVAAFAAERDALLGTGEFDPFSNAISPSEATYLAFDRADLINILVQTYRMAGYVQPSGPYGALCPSHIGVELDFMRLCLEHVAWGEERYLDLASRFFRSHLREWGVLFAVVLREKAVHPGLIYTSYALDKFIACESITFRHSLPALCIQRAVAD